MRAAYIGLLAGALLLLDPGGADPARAKLVLLLPGLALLALAARAPAPPDRLEALLALAAGLGLGRAALGPFPGRLEGLAAPLVLAGSYLVARRLLTSAEATRALGVLGGLAALATLAEPLLFAFRTSTGTHPAGELVGPTANPALTAGLLVLALPAAGALAPWVAVPVLAALLGTLSRAGLLGLATLALRRGLPARALLAGLVLGLALLVLGGRTGYFDPGQLVGTRTLRARIDMHTLLLPALAERPLLGHGPGAVGIVYGEAIRRVGRPQTLPDRVDHAHDPFLQLALECGALGLGTGALLLATVGSRLRRDPGPAADGLLGFGIAELFGTGSGSPLSLALAGLALAGLDRAPAPAPAAPGRGPALALGLALAALVPAGLGAARAERARARIRSDAARGRPPEPLPVETLAWSPEARLDLASARARAGQPGAAAAGWLALEAAFPGCGGAEQNRRALRRWLGREPPPAGPAPP